MINNNNLAKNIAIALAGAVIITAIPDVAHCASDWAGSAKAKIDEGTSGFKIIAGGLFGLCLMIYAIQGLFSGQFELRSAIKFLIAGILMASATLIAEFLVS